MYLNEKKELVFGDPEDRKHALGIGQSRKAAYKELAEKIDSGEIRAVGAHATRLSHLPSQLRTQAPKVSGRSVDSLRAQLLAETTDEELRDGYALSQDDGARWRVISEQRTYRKDRDEHGLGSLFLEDVMRATLRHDQDASLRLSRHMSEERLERGKYLERAPGDLTTSGVSGLTVPSYVTDQALPMVMRSNLRPFADLCQNLPLPPTGVQVHVPAVSTNSAVSVGTTELASVQATAGATTDHVANVMTCSGMQTASWQVLDRGHANPTLFLDLFAAYHTALDSQLINDATNGLTGVGVQDTFTQASPDGPSFYQALLKSASASKSNLKNRNTPDVALMPARRLYWYASQMPSSFAMVSSDTEAVKPGDPVMVRLPNGLLALADENCSELYTTAGATSGGTNCVAFVLPSSEMLLFEDQDAPYFLRFDQNSSGRLGTMLVLEGYFAFMFARYSGAVRTLVGSGMVAPSGFSD